jgi:hypothetical protein
MGVVWCVLRGSSPHMCVPRSPVCVQLAPSASFRFTVSVTTFLGAVATKAVEVMVASAPVPLVVVDGPAYRTVSADTSVSLTVLGQQKSCGANQTVAAGLAYQWTLLSADPISGACCGVTAGVVAHVRVLCGLVVGRGAPHLPWVARTLPSLVLEAHCLRCVSPMWLVHGRSGRAGLHRCARVGGGHPGDPSCALASAAGGHRVRAAGRSGHHDSPCLLQFRLCHCGGGARGCARRAVGRRP